MRAHPQRRWSTKSAEDEERERIARVEAKAERERADARRDRRQLDFLSSLTLPKINGKETSAAK